MRGPLAFAAGLVLLGLTTGCGGAEPAMLGTGRGPSQTPTTTPVIKAVFVDPEDPADLHVSLGCVRVPAPGEPSPVDVAEAPDQIVLELTTPVLEPPCNPVQLEVRLREPLGDRSVVSADGAEVPVDTYVAPDPARFVPAECTEEAARAAVASDVDGGLRSDLVGCLDGWMAVRTSTNACPATGERPAAGCIANSHTVYWRDAEGRWEITGFDGCDHIRRQYPGPPPALCDQAG